MKLLSVTVKLLHSIAFECLVVDWSLPLETHPFALQQPCGRVFQHAYLKILKLSETL